ncbi:MAG: DUF1801 domain-containing protein [Thermoplasmata archaeon]
MARSPPSVLIDRLIDHVGDWRGERLSQIRQLMHEADAEIVEEFKWMGTPTWSHDGIVAIANPHKGKVKITFPQGAHLPDPQKLFNAGLGGSMWRAIDIFEPDAVNEKALKELIRAAVDLNRAQLADKAPSTPRPRVRRRSNSPPSRRTSASKR